MLQLSGMNVLERHMFEWPADSSGYSHSAYDASAGKWELKQPFGLSKNSENGFVENEKYDLFRMRDLRAVLEMQQEINEYKNGERKMAKKRGLQKYNCVLEMSKWMGSNTPKAFKAAILKEAVRQNANSGGRVEKRRNKSMQSRKA